MIKLIKIWFYWLGKKKGKLYNDYERGPGYYLPLGVFMGKDLEHYTWTTKMDSGKVATYQLTHYTTFSDPSDMVEKSQWNFIGYEGEKPIREYTFREFWRFCK